MKTKQVGNDFDIDYDEFAVFVKDKYSDEAGTIIIDMRKHNNLDGLIKALQEIKEELCINHKE